MRGNAGERNKLIVLLFKKLSDAEYILVKNEFESCSVNSDFDIITSNIQTLLLHIDDEVIEQARGLGFRTSIIWRGTGHVHVDFIDLFIDKSASFRSLEPTIRLDIYHFKRCFFKYVLRNTAYQEFINDSQVSSAAPCALSYRHLSARHENVFRYLEFVDKFSIYPSKYKHFDSLVSTLSRDEFALMIEDVHRLISISPLNQFSHLRIRLRVIRLKVMRRLRLIINYTVDCLSRL